MQDPWTQMDTWSSANRLLSIRRVSKDRLFYDQYEYVICVKMPEVSVLRYKTHRAINQELDYRQTWRGNLGARNFGGSWHSHHQRTITEEIRENCHEFLDFLESCQDYKAWYSQDWVYIYSNDLALLRKIESLPYVIPVDLKQAIVDQERNTILVRSSSYSKRSYFRSWKPTESEARALRNFLSQQQDLRLSPSLQQWIKSEWSYVRENFFIDHNDNGIELLLSLVANRPIRKTVTIKHDK